MLSDKDIEDLEEKFSDSFIFSKESKFKNSHINNNYDNDSFLFSKESKFKDSHINNNYDNDSLQHFYDFSKIKTKGILQEKNIFKDKTAKKTNTHNTNTYNASNHNVSNHNINSYKTDKYTHNETPRKTNNNVNNYKKYQENLNEEPISYKNINLHKNNNSEEKDSQLYTNTFTISKSIKEDINEGFNNKDYQSNNKNIVDQPLNYKLNKENTNENHNSKSVKSKEQFRKYSNKENTNENHNSKSVKNNITDYKNTENLTKLQHELDNLKDTHKRMLQIKSKLLYLIDIEVQKVKKSIIFKKNEEIKSIINKYQSIILEKDSIINNLKLQANDKIDINNRDDKDELEIYKRKVEKYKDAYIKLKEKYRRDILNKMM
ncbi:hypothetical protein CWI38_0091p0040 [Hamiltosporidium tvaerminnensis]|uniref:Uncharacterized protein n=1 Tax=Hamiltosporidium tvaerminnensis TaxID=1176355 RepID=A0A4Q9LZ35_9MICR|nr:hypothetical protein CWI38_0261p0040 [Hamiltosporidium tvaerminnensis]TBU20310.1 hypothetical protein CWI38_0091p0040 [Hamiltosporidium tvaerminnensis]